MFVEQAAELWWRKVLIRVAPGISFVPSGKCRIGWHLLADQVNIVPHQE
jgi:hypothetical protein